jgi:glycosyltransferase involved in cell wall biosynthesis
LSVVIPTYNEAPNILGTLENVTAALAGLPVSYEILVVDDGSSDGTAAVVTTHAHRFRGVRLLINERNMGFGWTYRRGGRSRVARLYRDGAWRQRLGG